MLLASMRLNFLMMSFLEPINVFGFVKELLENMYETMYASHGVGLAAPQIGQSIRVFVID